MATVTEHKSLSGVPRWDGEQKTCGRYMAVFEAIGEYQECEDAFDEFEMSSCPTKSEYDQLMTLTGTAITVAVEKQFKLWKQT